MGTIIAFPIAAPPRAGTKIAPRSEPAQVMILPVVRIERDTDETNGGSGPEEGAAPGRRRKRRARS